MSIWSLTKSNFHSAVRGVRDAHRAIERSHERLASGDRIYRAAEDSAGLAVSTNLDAERMSASTARRNTNDALSMMEIAGGALKETNALFKRMRELAVQAASGTLDDTERGYLEAEFRAHSTDLARIRDTTEFNGVKFLDGSKTTSASVITDTTGPNAMRDGDIRINGTIITGSLDDGVSYSNSDKSALSKATAINLKTSSHGVTATATNTQVGVSAVPDGAFASLFVINGVQITNDGGFRSSGRDADGAIRGLINGITDQTGVWADVNETGTLILTAVDGRNFTVQGGNSMGFTAGPGETSFDGQFSLTSDGDIDLSGNSEPAIGIAQGVYAAGAGLSVQAGKGGTIDDRLFTGIDSTTAVGVLSLDNLSLSSAAAAQISLQFIDTGLDHINKQQA